MDEDGVEADIASSFKESNLPLLVDRFKLADRCVDKRRRINDFLFLGLTGDTGDCSCGGA
jgi:hypothetical protein